MAFTDRTPTSVTGGGPTLSVNKPTGTASNDLILLFVQTESASTAPTTPTGFTYLGGKTSTLQSMRVDVYYRVADGTEGSTFSVTGGTGVGWMEIICHTVAGGATSSPVDVSSSNANTTSGTAVTGTSVTTTAVDEILFYGIDWNGGSAPSTPTGYTSLLSDGVTGFSLSSLVQSSSGATGTISSTITSSDAWITWVVAIKPAGGGTVSSGTVNTGGGPHGLKSVVADALGNAKVGNTGDLDFGIQVGGGGRLDYGILTGGKGQLTASSDALASATNVGGGPEGIASVVTPYNLLPYNLSTFENGLPSAVLYGLGSGNVPSIDSTTAQDGTSSLKATTDGLGTFQFLTIPLQAAAFAPGATYEFSAYMKSSGTPTLRFYCQADQNLPTNIRLGNANSITLSTAWARYSFLVTMPANIDKYTTIGIRWDTGSPAQATTVWMDAVEIAFNDHVAPWTVGVGDLDSWPANHGGGLMQGYLAGAAGGGLAPLASAALAGANVGGPADGLAYGFLLGGGPSGLAVASVAAAGVVDVGSLASPGGDLATVISDALASLGAVGGGPDGLAASSYALMGNWSAGTPNPSGIKPFTPTILLPIFALLGGSGGILPSGGVFITAPRVHFGQRNVPGGGISNPFGGSSVSYPGGHWALVVCWMWRQTSPGVFGWVACPVKVWRNPGPNWSTLTT